MGIGLGPHAAGLFAGLGGLCNGALGRLQAAACVLVILACIKYLKK